MTEEDYLKKTRRLCCIWTENEAVDPPGDDNNNAATDQFALKIFRGDKTGFQDRLNHRDRSILRSLWSKQVIS